MVRDIAVDRFVAMGDVSRMRAITRGAERTPHFPGLSYDFLKQ